MGYTHYWNFKGIPNSVAYARALRDINKLARFKKDILSGYSAHAPANVYTGVMINGKRKDGHEDFTLRALPKDCINDFCKTAYKPYDVVVTAALAILKHRLKDTIQISSDGYKSDWVKGVKLARKVTGLAIKSPIVSQRELYVKSKLDKEFENYKY